MTANNIIKKQVFIIDCNNHPSPLTLQAEASAWCSSELIPLLAKSLEKYSGIEEVIFFDQIEVSLDVDESMFTNRVVEKISNQIEGIIQERMESNTGRGNGYRSSDNLPAPHQSRNETEAFLFFLQHGYLPWWSSIKTLPDLYEDIKKWLARLTAIDTESFTNLLHHVTAAKRFSSSLPTDLFISLLSSISEKTRQEINMYLSDEKVSTGQIEISKNDQRLKDDQKKPVNEYVTKTRPFRVFASYLRSGYFSATGYFSNKRAFHESVIQIAASLSEAEKRELKSILSDADIAKRFITELPEEICTELVSSIAQQPIEEISAFFSACKFLGSILKSSDQQTSFALKAKETYLKLLSRQENDRVIRDYTDLLSIINQAYHNQKVIFPGTIQLIFQSVFSRPSDFQNEEERTLLKRMLLLQSLLLKKEEKSLFSQCVKLRTMLINDEQNNFLSRLTDTTSTNKDFLNGNDAVAPAGTKKVAGETLFNKVLDKDNQLLEQQQASEKKEGIYITNAGLILLAPFLPRFFENLGIVANSEFLSKDAGLAILQWLVTGSDEYAEFELVLPKIICGMEPEESVTILSHNPDHYKIEGENLLLSVIEHWAILKHTSVDGLRQSFLQREGKLSLNREEWLLQVEQKPYDMLLAHIPWNIQMIKLSWMPTLVRTEWMG